MTTDQQNDYFLDGEEPENRQPEESPRTITFGGGNAPARPAAEPQQPAPRKPRHRFRRFVTWTVVIGVAVLAVVFYLRYFNPYAVEARATGYVTSLEKRGIIFKTYEGIMATETSMGDTTRVYTRDFPFTVRNDSLAKVIQQAMTDPGQRMTLVYEKYYGTLPWRGSSTNVVTAVESK